MILLADSSKLIYSNLVMVLVRIQPIGSWPSALWSSQTELLDTKDYMGVMCEVLYYHPGQRITLRLSIILHQQKPSPHPYLSRYHQ